MAQKLSRPLVALMLGIEVLPLDRAQQIGHLVGAVGEWVSGCVVLDLEIEGIGRRMVEANDALKAKLGGPSGESSDRDAVAEHVVHPSDVGRFRRDRERRIEQL